MGDYIFLVPPNMSVSKFNKYYAIASGSSYSLGALDLLCDQKFDAEAIARKAVASAITLTIPAAGKSISGKSNDTSL
jgi:ATP-dependent protease HslVU (ClpYQ) peptidase subunit